MGVGVARLSRKFRPKNGAIIILGHRVADDDEGCLQGLRPSWLAEQLDYLSRHYHFLSLSKLLDCYERHQSIPPNSVVITFDDGFRDNFTNAYPILQQYHVPATVFLATGCVSSGDLPLPQQVGCLCQKQLTRTVQLGTSRWHRDYTATGFLDTRALFQRHGAGRIGATYAIVARVIKKARTWGVE